jgi:hypothetical protein
MTADQTVDRVADKLQELADQMAGEGGLKAKLAEPLAEDAELLRRMKPSLIKARARGQAPTNHNRPSQKPRRDGDGPNPWIVVGAALVAGIVLAKWIDWRGHAHPRD